MSPVLPSDAKFLEGGVHADDCVTDKLYVPKPTSRHFADDNSQGIVLTNISRTNGVNASYCLNVLIQNISAAITGFYLL